VAQLALQGRIHVVKELQVAHLVLSQAKHVLLEPSSYFPFGHKQAPVPNTRSVVEQVRQLMAVFTQVAHL